MPTKTTPGSSKRRTTDRPLRDRLLDAIEALQAALEDPGSLAVLDRDDYRRLQTAAGRIARPDPARKRALARELRRARRREERSADDELLAACGIRKARSVPFFETPSGPAPRETASGKLYRPRACYVCKKEFDRVHAFYDAMCVPCGDENLKRRERSADLTGRTALVTGARVKIGYQAAIKLLRAGARVIATTRFPDDARERYARELDSATWLPRLRIEGIDLRHTPSVEELCRDLLATEPRLDFLLNNACQTIHRPSGFYRHLVRGERRNLLMPLEATELFPAGRLDADRQQIDLRRVNSWRLDLADVTAAEMLEVQLVNAVAPFVLNARLKPLMLATPERDKHIVNVSAMEGQFYRTLKTTQHPHTNMAKASLNMLTRTSAADYVADGIHMNSVDTGWVTDEDPFDRAERKRAEGFHPPLDIVDGAARIVDPIFDGFITGRHVWGRFLKDYRPTDW